MEFEQILKLVDHVSASHLESFCYEGDFSNLYCVYHKSGLCEYSSAVWMDLWTLFTICLHCCGSGFTCPHF